MVRMHFAWKQGRHRPDPKHHPQAASTAFLCCTLLDKILNPVAWPLGTQYVQTDQTLWMFIFAGCFDLPLAPQPHKLAKPMA